MMNGTIRETHKQLDKTRLTLWSLVMEAHDKGKKADAKILMDAYNLVFEEMLKLELSYEWELMLRGERE